MEKNINKLVAAITAASPNQKRGTMQWAAKTLNIGIGCSHACLYCYAKRNALRFRRISSPADWTVEHLKNPLPEIPKASGTVMFPSTHDITPYYLPAAIDALKALLEKGNQVLIVSKPHLQCIADLCDELAPDQDRIVFRFTIGSLDDRVAAFWEPGAPSPHERLICLQYAYAAGFVTSVSMEPMLAGTDDALTTFEKVAGFVREKIWIGKMNQVRRRVAQTTPIIRAACDRIIALQSDDEILRLVNQLGANPKVAWKDSILDVIRAHSPGSASTAKAMNPASVGSTESPSH